MLVSRNIARCAENGFRHELISGEIHETVAIVSFLSHIPILIRNRSNIAQLIQIALQPFDNDLLKPEDGEIVKEYVRWVNLFGVFLVIVNFLILNFVGVIGGTLLTLPFRLQNTPVQDLPLPYGGMPFPVDSYPKYALAFVISSSCVFGVGAFYCFWPMIMMCCSSKMQAKLKLLSNALTTLDERAEMSYASVLELADRGDRGKARVGQRRAALLTHCASEALHEVVRQHLVIMSQLKTVDLTFRLSMMLQIQTKLTMCALLLQIMVNSHKLHRALYRCHWTDKSPSFRRTLLVMMTVSSRTLCLKVGGMYPLGIVFLRQTMNALYSYINLLFTLREN